MVKLDFKTRNSIEWVSLSNTGNKQYTRFLIIKNLEPELSSHNISSCVQFEIIGLSLKPFQS